MKFSISILLSSILLFTAFSLPVHATGDLTSPLPIKSADSISERALTMSDDILPGETSSRTYTYTVLRAEPASKSKFLSLDWSHSELLIPPSAVTIEIDGEPIRSIALSKKSAEDRVTIPLRDEHLTKGTHEITVRFTGILRGRMCDTGNTSGSWFTVRSSSFVSIGNKTNLSLKEYSSTFTQTFNKTLTLVLPDHPDAASYEAALLLYRQLKNDASDSDNVLIRYERQLKSFTGNYIFIGEQDGFTGPVATLIDDLDTSLEDDEMLLQRVNLVEKGNSVDALFVLANNSESFEGKLDHLLLERHRQQFDGEKLILSSTPSPQAAEDVVSLRTLGASDLILSGAQTKSTNYFYPLPVIDTTSSVEIDVTYKLSESLAVKEDGQPSAELIAWINNVPHSIPLDNDPDDMGFYHHKIRVAPSTLERATFLDVSFEARGLRSEAPCTDNDVDRWIYVSSDSQVTLPTSNGNTNNEVFLNMASLFATEKGVVLVVPDDDSSATLKNVATVISGLPVTPLTHQVEVVRASELDESILEERSVMFVGNPEDAAILKEKQEDWIVSGDKGIDLTQYGFTPETSAEYAWIQPSPWNTNRALVVIATTDSIDSSLMQTLAFPNETFSVAVKNQNGAIFTNSSTISDQADSINTDVAEIRTTNSIWYFVGFATLIALTVGLLLMMRRRKKSS
ncbi:cellulose biosynthesis cyclic di-GMP-binding regulatory protein BcsB [Exiguobacterium sp. s5]|uniref:cellulose biosynthesis cyclic di-GMP-binding regulatory protein BcsB n=1 Tax=Exiguobacterium sp. s5 TaxID=2751239 RepID=UPI001BE99531|nr:cellulose biosynthesis cyclic di-GMP-binding regulatory protein BcsB [Exiguobacterium sp. s5]